MLVPQFLPQYLVISETELNKKFHNAKFLLSNYELKNGYFRSHLICKMKKIPTVMTSIISSSELQINNKKWIVCSVFRPS